MQTTDQEVLYVPAGEAAGEGKSLRLGGNRLEIKASSEHTGGAFAVLEYRMAAHTPGPPPHLHRRTDEAFHVLEGELTFHLEDRSMEAGPGDFVLVPRGVVHTFENAGSSEARFLEVAAPGSFVGYFEELLAAVPASGGPLDPATIAALYEKYDIVPADTQQD
jgi:mannose-6-phosphate isomerase-like protein (cupin superfamily)